MREQLSSPPAGLQAHGLVHLIRTTATGELAVFCLIVLLRNRLLDLRRPDSRDAIAD